MIKSYKYSDITDKIIKAFYSVYNTLGHGFLEKVYENSIQIELEEMRFPFEMQKPIDVFFKDRKVGEYFADIIAEDKVIIELKACESLREEHEAQLLNYLRATNIEVGLLLNFGKTQQVKRKVFYNEYKIIHE